MILNLVAYMYATIKVTLWRKKRLGDKEHVQDCCENVEIWPFSGHAVRISWHFRGRSDRFTTKKVPHGHHEARQRPARPLDGQLGELRDGEVLHGGGLRAQGVPLAGGELPEDLDGHSGGQ